MNDSSGPVGVEVEVGWGPSCVTPKRRAASHSRTGRLHGRVGAPPVKPERVIPRRLDDGRVARERAESTALRGCRIARALGGRVEVVEASPADRHFPLRVTESLGVCLKDGRVFKKVVGLTPGDYARRVRAVTATSPARRTFVQDPGVREAYE